MGKSSSRKAHERQVKKKAREDRAREAAMRATHASLGPEKASLSRISELILAGAGGYDTEGQPWLNPDKTWEIDPHYWFAAAQDDAMTRQHTTLGIDPPIVTYVNGIYQVAVYEEPCGDGWPDMWHLSIKRRDREPLDENRWRTLQSIKNEIVDPECEAVELYPAETRLVDTANQYHLFVLKARGMRFPFGFKTRLVTNNPGGKAVQRERVATDGDEADFQKTLEAAGDLGE